MGRVFVGVDLGGTNIKIGCFDSAVKLLGKASVPTGVDTGPESVVERIVETCRRLVTDSALSLQDVAAVGIGTPGPADYQQGIVISSANMPKFRNTPLRDMVSRGIGKPGVLENDANVACWGEFVLGAGRGVKDMVFFTLGTGIGGGIVSGGRLVHGFSGNAAELGHIIIYPDGRLCGCGQRGCAEAYASASATARRATEAIQAGRQSSLKRLLNETGQITCKQVYEHLAAGDELAKEITDETAKVLALLCIDVHHTTEPQRIVFAGGMIGAGAVLLDRIKYYFNQHLWKAKTEPVEICFATLGEDAGIIGAAALARQTKSL
jgi:glucokinase